MESITYHEEYIHSSEEVVHHHDSDEESKELGVGRSYECVFCKRGFNTAQALGGHMNIHRKDRARKPNNSNIISQDAYTGPRLYHQIIPSSTADHIQSSNHRRFSPQDHQQPMLSYATYFPPSSSASRSSYHHDQNDSDRDNDQPQPLDVHGDWRMRLSLEFPPSEMNQEKDLDLELRLGYLS